MISHLEMWGNSPEKSKGFYRRSAGIFETPHLVLRGISGAFSGRQVTTYVFVDKTPSSEKY